MNKLSINIVIAGRKYPMKVKASEEAKVRNVASKINTKYEQISALYKTRDSVDVMAIMLFELMMENENKDSVCINQSQSLVEISDALEELVKGG